MEIKRYPGELIATLTTSRRAHFAATLTKVGDGRGVAS
jgi:hypothetical protein